MNVIVWVIIGVVIGFCLLTMWGFIDIASKDFGSMEKKAIWVFINAIPFIGCMVYLFVGFRKGKKQALVENK